MNNNTKSNFLKRFFFSLLIYSCLPFLLLQAQIPSFPAGFSRVLVSNGLSNATAFDFAPDGRIFVALQNGEIRIIKNGTLLPTTFIKINVDSKTERGLVGLTLDPNFSANQYLYVYYTLPDGSRNRISRITANGDVALAGSESIILNLDPITAEMHNGGTMKFGKDEKLFVAVGENNVPANSQNLDNHLGKILRINVDGSAPADNPFNNGSDARRRIWAYGLRNPFNFDIHPVSGKIYVNDVGYDNWEEINDASIAGRNFGWPNVEGNGTNPAFINPLFAYPHGLGEGVRGCAITGGAFFAPTSTNYPNEYKGKYFFQDLCFRWINYLDNSSGNPVIQPFASNLGDQAISITVGKDGNLYYLERGSSSLYKIIYSTNTTPLVVNQPKSVTTSEAQPANFSVTATGAATLKYQWQKNGVNIPGANTPTYAIQKTVKGDEGGYRVVISNSSGSVTSSTATLTITPFNAKPTAKILKPSQGSFYKGGDIITFEGSATDPEDGVLPASAFTWYAYLYHGSHYHDSPAIAKGVKSGSFSIPTTGETSSDVWYRVILMVKDSKNLSDTTFVDIRPFTSKITLTSVPSGLQLTLDGQTIKTPYTITGVEGVQRALGVITPQTPPGKNYKFSHWSDGGASLHTISTPTNDVTYTAVFNEVELREPANPGSTVNGLEYSYYEGTGWTKIPEYDKMTAVKTGITNNFDIGLRNREDNFGFKFSGYIEIPYDDAFTFTLKSDDGAKLFIGNTVVVDLDGNHAAWEISGTIGLQKGLHEITILYFDKEFDQVLELSYQGLNLAKQKVPNSALFRKDDTSLVIPSITSHPSDVTMSIGETATFSVSATGSPTLHYQWQKDSQNIKEANSSSLSISNLKEGDGGNYTVIVSNLAGNVTSSAAKLTVNKQPTPPIIISQPISLVVKEGKKASFSVSATGSSPLTYQWEKDGEDIPNATANKYILNVTKPTDAGIYRVIISNAHGTITSNEVELQIVSEENGLNYSYYEGDWNMLPDFNSLTPIKNGVTPSIDLNLREKDDYFGFIFYGFLEVPEDGTYTFYLESDDGAKFFLDSKLIIENDSIHASSEKSNNLELRKGQHAIELMYFDKEFDHVLNLSWSRHNSPKQTIPASAYFANTLTGTGPELHQESSAVKLYPNPSSGDITIQIPARKGENLKIHLFDKVGRTIESTGAVATTNGLNVVYLNLANFRNGAYIARIQKGRVFYYKNFIINK